MRALDIRNKNNQYRRVYFYLIPINILPLSSKPLFLKLRLCISYFTLILFHNRPTWNSLSHKADAEERRMPGWMAGLCAVLWDIHQIKLVLVLIVYHFQFVWIVKQNPILI